MADVPRQCVLVVDDAPENIMVLDRILRPDYQVRAANGGDRALEIAYSEVPPDIILLDIVMPGTNGFEVCRRLKEESATRAIPVIFVTSMDEAQDEAYGFSLGAVDYIHKPVSPSIVQARVRMQLALYDQNRELDRKVRERTAQLNETRMQVVRRLGRAGEFRDNETGLHVIRVSWYCRVIAQAMGMADEDVESIFNATPMHDIGKIGIRDEILLKPGKLDEDEFDTMKQHTRIGAEIIGQHETGLLEMARRIALTHHEKWNGKGYPNGLAGDEIPMVGQITAIADVFDALTSTRPYKKAWSVEDAVDLIKRESGQHFNPVVVRKFEEVLPQILQYRETYSDDSFAGRTDDPPPSA